MTYKQWQILAARVHAQVARIEDMMTARIRALTTTAGLDGSIFPIHLNNAWVSYQNGRPWPEVDYRLVCRARHLESRLFTASRIGDALLERTYRSIVRA